VILENKVKGKLGEVLNQKISRPSQQKIKKKTMALNE
tara:strand:+ start:1241 stop:1351 length:111 start_codon:yes stop_codon:yes gene_type:complete